MIKLKQIRFKSSATVTLGLLHNRWWTVEKPWVDLNNDGIGDENQSCIAAGTYTVKRHESPTHGECWAIQDVVGRTYIQIHVANYPRNVKGCLGVGLGINRPKDMVTNSGDALNEMLDELPDEWELEVIDAY